MNESTIAVRYAKALFSLAKEKQQLPDVVADSKYLTQVAQEVPEFTTFLQSPVLSTRQKQLAFNQLFANNANELTVNFLSLLLKNKREAFLPAILRNFLTRYRQQQGLVDATLTTAIPMSQQQVNQVKEKLAKMLCAKVELALHTNSELIGGFILKMDDKQLDASMASQLEKIKRALVHAEKK